MAPNRTLEELKFESLGLEINLSTSPNRTLEELKSQVRTAQVRTAQAPNRTLEELKFGLEKCLLKRVALPIVP